MCNNPESTIYIYPMLNQRKCFTKEIKENDAEIVRVLENNGWIVSSKLDVCVVDKSTGSLYVWHMNLLQGSF